MHPADWGHLVRRKLGVCVGLAVSCVMTAATARAQTPAVQFFFSSSDTAYVPVTSETLTAGQTFTLSIYYNATGFTATGNSYNVMDLFVGFDQSNSYGTSATPLDDRLTLADGDNPNGGAITTDPASSGFDELFAGANDLAGGQPTGQDGTLVRPYGVDIALALSPGAASLQDTSGPTHLLDIMFVNDDLAAGPETISVYNGGAGTDATTYVDGTQIVRPNTAVFTAMQAGSGGTMPEPAAFALAALGLIPVAGRKR